MRRPELLERDELAVPRLAAVVLACFLIGVLLPIKPYMAVATLSYSLMCAGLVYRENRGVHAPLMIAAMVLDLAVVLGLEIQRSAVKTAVSMELSPIQQAHILASTVALLLYFPAFYLGVRRLLDKGGLQEWLWHKRVAVAAFLFRSAGFLLMFSLLWAKHGSI